MKYTQTSVHSAFFLLFHPFPPSFLPSSLPHTLCRCSEDQDTVLAGRRGSWTRKLFTFKLLLIFSSNPTCFNPYTFAESPFSLWPQLLPSCAQSQGGPSRWPQTTPQRSILRLSPCSELCKAASELASLLPCFSVMMAPRPG